MGRSRELIEERSIINELVAGEAGGVLSRQIAESRVVESPR